MYSFRAFKVADLGTKIIPILYSFFEIGGMLVITLFTSLAFVHALLSLDNRPIRESGYVVLGIFKLLLVGGDDGIDTVLGLGGGGTGTWFTGVCFVVSVFIYCICLMNIFIAVLYEGYREAHKDAMPSFLQERARICLQSMCLPRWRRRWRRLDWPWTSSALLAGVAVPAWVALIAEPQVHPLLPSALLFCTVLLIDLFMAQHPWHARSNCHFLWWCSRAEVPVTRKERRKQRETSRQSAVNLE